MIIGNVTNTSQLLHESNFEVVAYLPNLEADNSIVRVNARMDRFYQWFSDRVSFHKLDTHPVTKTNPPPIVIGGYRYQFRCKIIFWVIAFLLVVCHVFFNMTKKAVYIAVYQVNPSYLRNSYATIIFSNLLQNCCIKK
jgi:hypothetical protein